MSTSIHITQGAEPIFFEGGNIGCLILHGLSASPQEVYWLGKHLSSMGATCYIPRLYGHGVSLHDFRRMRWQDWYLSALDGYSLLKTRCDKVFVAGLSMGSLLALKLAADEAVQGVIAIASPLELTSPTAWTAHLLRYFHPFVLSRTREADPLNKYVEQKQRERGERVTGRVAYYKHSTVGISELLKLQREVRSLLPAIKAPALLIFAEKDDAASLRNLEMLQRDLTASPKVESLILKDSGHVITSDVEHETANAAVWQYIERYQ